MSERTYLQMAVEMDHADRSILPVDATQKRKCDCVVPPKCDHTWERSSFLRWAWQFSISGWRARENDIVAFFNLFDGERVVISMSALEGAIPEIRPFNSSNVFSL